MKLGLISCSKQKQDYPCTAYEMYSKSDLFRKAYKYCQKTYGDTMILSAKYGLLITAADIRPYNVTLNEKTPQERKVWADLVYKQILSYIQALNVTELYFHAGRNYRNLLIPRLSKIIPCYVPLEGLGIGQQKAWYLHNIGNQTLLMGKK
jgi:hypothetical protein